MVSLKEFCSLVRIQRHLLVNHLRTSPTVIGRTSSVLLGLFFTLAMSYNNNYYCNCIEVKFIIWITIYGVYLAAFKDNIPLLLFLLELVAGRPLKRVPYGPLLLQWC